MFYHNINPVLLDIGPFEIRYYGLFYAIGFAFSYYLIYYLAKRKELGITKDDAADLILYNVIGVIIGARIAYVIFYNLKFYIGNLTQILAVWNGGLSFHGGLIGAFAATLYFCRKKKIEFYEIADIMVIPAALSLALGRIGNFINGELVGRVSNSGFCINYESSQYIANPPKGCRYPSQIFESLKNTLMFVVLWLIKGKKLPKGAMFWAFASMYGLLRALAEFARQPDEQVGFIFNYFTMGQLLSFPLFILGAVMIFRLYKNNPHNL